jgi:hypothetical protein
MNVNQAKAIPLETILGKYGHTAKQSRGADLWYESPFRKEETPSFVVNTRKNVWFDHGEGKGGNVIDLVSRLSGETSVASILKVVAGLVGEVVSPAKRDEREGRDLRAGQNQRGERVFPTSEKELSQNALGKYLEGRAIPIEFARKYVKEVHYQAGGKPYFGIGFKNQSGGYEIRNPYFKGTIGTKDISVIPGTNPKIVNIFEGFMDFLSWPLLSGDTDPQETAVILNSVSLADRAVAYFHTKAPEEIRLFLDNDSAGRSTVERIRTALPKIRVVDMSDRYRESEDVNRELLRLRDRKAELQRAMGKGK